MGNIYTFSGMMRAHGVAPSTHGMLHIEFDVMKEEVGGARVLELAKKIAFGSIEERKSTVKLVYSGEWY